ncbi:nucleoside hydrolase [Streptomyces sp. NRRL F-4489]|uniref:nucleoside hydrolase n=1 Tax=Streptomyces sp. NRRL F-4489 TaxID=1609095 RepID=UPI00083353EB|nr:nucleoside hydrolase [Streptomyces sp. NRRL F-4489]
MTDIWYDCDTGYDDMITLVLLAHQPDVRLLGVSAVVGNTTLANTLRNTLRVVDAFRIQAPVHAGATKPLAAEPCTIEGLLGEDGLGARGTGLPATDRRPEPQHAVPALIDCLRAHPGQVTIVATAPLTNIALAVRTAPDIVPKIRELVFMGGGVGRGNHTAAAEFNAYADPEAGQVLCDSGIPLRMFGLNLTNQTLIDASFEDAMRAAGGPVAEALAHHTDFYLRIRDKDKNVPMPLHDPNTAVYLAHPEFYTFRPARLDFETTGRLTRGETVCEFRVPRKAAPNAQIAITADSAAVTSYWTNEITSALTALRTAAA